MRLVGRAEAGEALELRIVRAGAARKVTVEPEGEPMPWVDPQHWGGWFEKHLRRGRGHSDSTSALPRARVTCWARKGRTLSPRPYRL